MSNHGDDGPAPTSAPPRRGTVGGMAVVAALFLLAALFLWGLFALTAGKRRAPPPETRDPAKARGR